MMVYDFPTHKRLAGFVINAEEYRVKTIRQCRALIEERLPVELEGRLKELLRKAKQ